jgi:hypothetical protein
MSNTQQPINDGGTAFPSSQYGFVAPDGHTTGMSLRDWFAGMAISTVLEYWQKDDQYTDEDLSCVATDCYELADAMIEARKKDYIIDRGEDR